MNVMILAGGSESEHDVSLRSALYYSELMPGARIVDLSSNPGPGLRLLERELVERRPDVVVNATHGGYGEGGPVQMVLEEQRVAFTGSGSVSSRACMDKMHAKTRLHTAGIPVPNGQACDWISAFAEGTPRVWSLLNLSPRDRLVVKPNAGGSSDGVRVIDARTRLDPAWYAPHERVMLERFVPGREVTVAVLGNEAFMPVETVLDEHAIVDRELKYGPARVKRLAATSCTNDRLREVALQAGFALGCTSAYRVDVRVDQHGAPHVLELNTQPGMRAGGVFDLALGFSGVSREAFARLLLEDARVRAPEPEPA